MKAVPGLTCFAALALWLTAGAETVETSLTLERCVEIALRDHPSLKEARATVEAANQRVWQQVAGYLPRGAFKYNLTRFDIPVEAAVRGVEVGGGTAQQVSQLFNFNTTAFAINQPLFDFGRNLDSIESARASRSAGESDLESTRQTVIFNVKQTYYAALLAQRLERVAEEALEQSRKHLEEPQARYDAGLAAEFDVTQEQVQVANDELGLITARSNVPLARESLYNAMGVSGSFALVDDNGERTPMPLEVDEAVALARAYASRPELKSLEAQQRAGEERVAALRKEYLPSVSGDAEYDFTGRDFPLREGWAVGLTVNFPLFDSILTTARLGEAKADLRKLEAQTERQRQQILLEVRRGLVNLRAAAESIQMSEKVLERARKNLDLAAGRYSTGVGSIIELTGAQTSLTAARGTYEQALYNYRVSVARLEKAIGGEVLKQ